MPEPLSHNYPCTCGQRQGPPQAIQYSTVYRSNRLETTQVAISRGSAAQRRHKVNSSAAGPVRQWESSQ